MKSSGSIVLNKDYAYNSQFDSIYAGGFVIDKSITIDFNGHTVTVEPGTIKVNVIRETRAVSFAK